MQETTNGGNGPKKKVGRPITKLHPVKGYKVVDLEALSTRLYRQSAEIELFSMYFDRRLGRANMSKNQEKEADRIRSTFPDMVNEPLHPQVGGKLDWPYRLGDVDIIKLAWAIKLKQPQILVPEGWKG